MNQYREEDSTANESPAPPLAEEVARLRVEVARLREEHATALAAERERACRAVCAFCRDDSFTEAHRSPERDKYHHGGDMSTKTKASIFDRNVCGPTALELPDNMRNAATIAEWWGRVKLYAEAMDALDRAVILKKSEEGDWYLSSVENFS